MRVAPLCPLFVLIAPLGAQDLLYYKFDGQNTTEVVNHAEGPEAIAGSGVLESNTGESPLTEGRFGGALAGGSTAAAQYNRVRTGWSPSEQPLHGDMTLAFWIKERTASTSQHFLCGMSLSGGTNVFTGGTAGRGLYYRGVLTGGGNGGNHTDLRLRSAIVDIQTLAASGWTHVALVVDSAAATAEWYVDGDSVTRLNNVGAARIISDGQFTVGYRGTVSECNYDQDEFLLSNRAYTAEEIQALFEGAPQSLAGDRPYMSGVTEQCGSATLRSYGGLPVMGNDSYCLELEAPGRGIYFLVLGFERDTLWGRVPLPTELRGFFRGCWLLTDVDYLRIGRFSDTVQIPMPIPVFEGAGFEFYAQGAVLERRHRFRFRRLRGVHASNGLEITVDR